MKKTSRKKPASPGVAAGAVGSAPWVVIVGSPRELLTGQFLEGPRDPKRVRIYGYGFTRSLCEAWSFPTEKQARAKALIVDRHMGWGEGVLLVIPRSAAADPFASANPNNTPHLDV